MKMLTKYHISTKYWFLLIIYAVFITKGLWISDDSLISIKQLFNFMHGYGFIVNYDQRVQAFSHPTWMIIMIIASLFTKTSFITIAVLHVLLSTLSLYLLFKYIYKIERSIFNKLTKVVLYNNTLYIII